MTGRVFVCTSVFPQAMSFEAHSLTVPSVMWLGLLPSDLQRFGLNIRYFLLPPPASNWDYILGTFRLFVLVSVAVALTFFPLKELRLRAYCVLSICSLEQI